MRQIFATVCLLVAASGPGLAQGWVNVTGPSLGPSTSYSRSSMCFDPVRNRTWLFSNDTTGLTVHAWDGSMWTQVPGSYPVNFPWRAVWHAALQQVVVLDASSSSSPLAQLQAWDGVSFTPLPGSSLTIQGQHYSTGIAYDQATGNLVLPQANGDVRIYDGTGWTTVMPPQQTSGDRRSLFYDQVRGRVAMVEEFVPQGTTLPVPLYWEWAGGYWNQRYPNPAFNDLWQVVEVGSHGFAFAMKFEPSNTPRAFSVADGAFSEIFLSNLPSNRQHPFMAYDSVRDRLVLYGGLNIYGGSAMLRDTWELDLGPSAAYSSFGVGCVGSGGVPQVAPTINTLPVVNSQFTLQVSNLPWTGPTFMWLGFSKSNYGAVPLPFNLGPLGAPLCDVLVSPDQLFATPNVLGTSLWTLAIPNMPGFVFYNQAIAFDTNANSLGLVFSNAGEGIIGQ